ncbi:hypothetical protein BDP81DRAFT_399455 [Colletotrichum phormii]|uniref:P-loop containing nucleoside triphosphate hydrolase protein n=1 Tax=Colletotrichum phormii TaxID=359342 RepID=A0AAI9ZHJ0_9PEZI|nr:uncharacterized protein BDP81DRAFT_399455 [Colletotrichum phormii]KAK1623454.1 hypothetical protein BDP81DRAFT_399455 [Colletotrichum phormii]
MATSRPTKVLSVGLPRTGSYSMMLALTELGFKDVYHGLNAIDSPNDWRFFGRASDALFPSLPFYTGKGMTAADWDHVFGPCEGITDIAAPFTPSLIDAYPEAKLVLVIRDYEKWRVEPMMGADSTGNIQKMMLGWVGGSNVPELESKLGEIYERHHEHILKTVPKERLLVYKLGEGWGPLCEFLEMPVLERLFPQGNEAAALRSKIFDKQKRVLLEAGARFAPWLVGAGAVAEGLWYTLSM